MSDPFLIRAHVPAWDDCVADYKAASAATRNAHANRRIVAYGPSADEKLDLYIPGSVSRAGRPVHLFIHGGYWRAFSKDDYAFVADTVAAAGAIAAVMDYTLMPDVRMETLVTQVRRAALWLAAHATDYGGDRRQFSVSGHSAGAHLASFLVCRAAHEPEVQLPALRALLLISGIYDLAPITECYLQPMLQLTPSEVARWSPLRAAPADREVAVDLIVGERETTPFHVQAEAFAAHLARAGVRSRLTTVADQDHMSIVREVGRPGSPCASHLEAAVRVSARP